MELIKDIWKKSDGDKFENYLKSLEQIKKQAFAQKIINTNLPLLAVSTPTLKKIAKEIGKGNFLSFLDLKLKKYYENIAINGFLIMEIENFQELKNRLYYYSSTVDNWACCDLLKFNICKENKQNFLDLSREYIKSTHTFTRRVGIVIWFSLIKFDDCFDEILRVIPTLENESEYYVNMALAWLVAECFIKRREETLKLLKSNHLNSFTQNKAIQKCLESFRVSAQDKQLLLKFKN